METHLFTYRCGGKDYLLEVRAETKEEAFARVRKMSLARYDGVLVQTVPVGFGWWAKLRVWIGNFTRLTGTKP